MAANSLHLPLFFLLLISTTTHRLTALPEKPSPINSSSILIALLDSQYTKLSELVEKAFLLHTLEEAVTKHNLTIFAPDNEALNRDLDSEFKRFLLKPSNIKSLQTLFLHHIIPIKLTDDNWPTDSTRYASLSHDHLEFSIDSQSKFVVDVKVVLFNSVVRPDGVIYGIDRVIIPKSVEREFNKWRSLGSIAVVKPEGAPEFDPRTNKCSTKKAKTNLDQAEKLSVYEAMAPALSLAPVPGPHRHFDGERQVKDFIKTLLHYGGYNEMADILVNLTNLATEMGRLISEGYVLTVLAPNDEAMAKLTKEQLSEPGAAEQIVQYHIVPEYQTEESMYNAVRRLGTVSYDTLRLPYKMVARETDGTVRFGESDDLGCLFDPNIYADEEFRCRVLMECCFRRHQRRKEELKG